MGSKAEKSARIRTLLESLYPETPIPLDHDSHFTLLIAVLLSAQTTDKKVNEVTPALWAAYPTIQDIAVAEPEAVRVIIREIGLAPTKSRNVVKLAGQLLSLHGGEVPNTYQALEALPGVGHKTASVVMSQAFGVPAFAVDTHIHRLAWRWGLSNGKNVVQTEKDLKRIFPEESWNGLHLRMIFFGREHCPALRHDPDICPICSWAGIKTRLKQEQRKRSPAKRRRL
jgi:endonuclease III